jgi:hypothetical protein
VDGFSFPAVCGKEEFMELECKTLETSYNENTDKSEASAEVQNNDDREREFWLSVKYSDVRYVSER